MFWVGRGSVVPTFKKQIAAGGPVTVTHPEIRRYFMTIPEAVQLVLQAAVLGNTGEVLMLNMGQPIKIVDLAKELIRLSGYEVRKDIEIVYTGLRPGEKLFEELLVTGEEYEPTEHEKLLIVKNASQIVPENLDATVEALCQASVKNDVYSIIFLLQRIVPGYNPKTLEKHLSNASRSSDVMANFNGNIWSRIKPEGS
jgi:FlaA1/EpsC-like NDP-sugar epimerase